MADGRADVQLLSTGGGRNGATALRWSAADGWEPVSPDLATEFALTVFLDRTELATLMCTPENLNYLVAGFLRSEGLIERLDDLALMRVCSEERVAEARLMRPREMPGRRILTSGCGGGVTFDEGSSLEPVLSELRLSPAQVLASMRLLQESSAEAGQRCGLHVSALADGEKLIAVARDVGRHNTLDKIWGECLFRDIPTRGRILLTTGRLSSEMMVKAARMGVPLTASLNSPTTRAVELAERLGITVAGYVRGSRLTVYSHPQRLQSPPADSLPFRR